MSKLRPFTMPIAAAAIGATLAVGAFIASRSMVRSSSHTHTEAPVHRSADIEVIRIPGMDSDLIEIDMNGFDPQAVMQEVMQDLEGTLAESQDLTEEQREQIQAAMEELRLRLSELEIDVEVDLKADLDVTVETSGGN